MGISIRAVSGLSKWRVERLIERRGQRSPVLRCYRCFTTNGGSGCDRQRLPTRSLRKLGSPPDPTGWFTMTWWFTMISCQSLQTGHAVTYGVKYKSGGKRKNREDCCDQISSMKGDDRRCFCPTQLHKPFRHLVPLGNCKANMGWMGIRPAALCCVWGWKSMVRMACSSKTPRSSCI